MPSTLVALYSLTKGSEYIVIAGFLVLFLSFWRFLTYKDKE
ncbi:MAG: sulfate respiration complex protein HmcD [Desulfomonilaceae bacterium]